MYKVIQIYYINLQGFPKICYVARRHMSSEQLYF